MRSRIILLAEDNSDDALIFSMMFRRATLPHTLHRVEDGLQAINWLKGHGEYADRQKFPMPNMLVLDLKMPNKTGFEVLEWLRAQKTFEEMPVIILSSSDENIDVKHAYQLGVTTYFVKSPHLQDVIQYLRLSS